MEVVAAGVSVGLLGWSMWGWMKDDERRQSRPKPLPSLPPGEKAD